MVAILLIIICVGFPLFVAYIDYKYKKSKENEINEEKELIVKLKKENNIPLDAEICNCKCFCFNEKYIEGTWDIYLWKENNILNFCGTTYNNEIKKSKIYIKNINYYNLEGEISYTSIIKGGELNFINGLVSGIIGLFIGFLIGIFTVGIGIGSIIGFILGILLGSKEKITTKENKIDNRKTYLSYKDDNEDKKIIFNSKAYDILSKIIPEKDKNYVVLNSSKICNNIIEDIEKLAELNQKGVLTDNEFIEKKKVLLDKIG